MKYFVIIALLSMVCNSVFSQYQKVLLTYGSPEKPRWILNCSDETQQDCILFSYFRNEKIQGKAVVFFDGSYYRPNGDAVIYFSNGNIFQQYTHLTGTLLTYYPNGALQGKMITPINGDIERKYAYYTSGTVMEEENSKREPGRQNLAYSYSREQDKIYDNHGFSYNYLKTFHGNGNLQSMIFIDADAPHLKYIYQFYSPDGQLDTAAHYINLHGSNINIGKRYHYHSNGELSEKVLFDDYGKVEGEQLRWSATGQLVWKTQYMGGYRQGKFETWWDNGKPKELSYYAGTEKHGPVLRWHHDGRLLEQGSYYRGNIVGITTIWDTLGGILGERLGSIEVQNIHSFYQKEYSNDKTIWLTNVGNYKNGLRDGEWQFFYAKKGVVQDKVGGICAIINYKNGLLDGMATIYYPNGERCLQTNFRDGFLDGTYISKTEEGFIQREGLFKKHLKNGLWRNYHYKSHQIASIEFYENGVQKEVYNEWDEDGFLNKERIDNQLDKQVEYYTYSKDGMKTKHVIPYGRKNMDTYEYDASGYLKKKRLLKGDVYQNYVQTEYYPNGQLSTQLSIENNKQSDIYWAWHENGQLKRQLSFENGLRDGTEMEWDQNGQLTIVRHFRKGIEINIETEEDALIECACNREPTSVNNRYMPMFSNYIEYEKVKNRTIYYTISESFYRSLFAREVQRYDEVIDGTVTAVKDFYVDVHNGLKLNFTPCRRGVNSINLQIRGAYNTARNTATVTVSDFDLSIDFPKTLLRPYDVENNRLLVTKIEKYQVSSVRWTVSELQYTDDGKYPKIEMFEKSGTTPCFQIAEIGETGVLLDGANPQMDFSPMSAVKLPWKKSKVENNYLSFDENRHYLLPSNAYLNGFIGVYCAEGKLYIPYNDGRVTANAQHLFLSGMEIYGNLEIATDDNLPLEVLKTFPDYLKSKGFDILESEIEDDEILRIFWRYVRS